MTLRIRLRLGQTLVKRLAKLASALAAVLTPTAAMAFVLGVWRLCADLKWAGEFVITSGVFSHWQVWIALAGVLWICAAILNRYGRGIGEEMAPPSPFPPGHPENPR
jgi:NADH:ubiquinone oxidoreductase subunit 4 (subunit M)